MTRPALHTALLLVLPLAGSLDADPLREPQQPRLAPSGHVLFRLLEEDRALAFLWSPGEEAPSRILPDEDHVEQLEWLPGAEASLLALVRDPEGGTRTLQHSIETGETSELPLPPSTRRLFLRAGVESLALVEAGQTSHRLSLFDLGSEAVHPTEIAGEILGVAISPKGDRAQVARRKDDQTELIEVALDSGEIRSRTPFAGSARRLAFDSSGERVVFVGTTPEEPSLGRLFLWSPGGAAPRLVSEEMVIARGDDLGPPVWSPEGEAVYTEAVLDGRARWTRLVLSSGEAKPVSPRELDATGGSGRPGGWAVVVSTELLPPELARLDAQGRVGDRTSFNEAEILKVSVEVLEAFVTRHRKSRALLYRPARDSDEGAGQTGAVVLLRDRGRGALTREFDPITLALVRADQAVLIPASQPDTSFVRRYRQVGPFVSQLARDEDIASEELALIAVGSDAAFGLWLTLHSKLFVATALIGEAGQLGAAGSGRAFGDILHETIEPEFFPRLVAGRGTASVLWVPANAEAAERIDVISERLTENRIASTTVVSEAPSATWTTILDWVEVRREQDAALTEPATIFEFDENVRASALIRARNDMILLERGVRAYVRDFGFLPRALSSLLPLPTEARGYIDLRELPLDPWGNDYVLRGKAEDFEILSLGADGRLGGEGEDADLSTRDPR